MLHGGAATGSSLRRSAPTPGSAVSRTSPSSLRGLVLHTPRVTSHHCQGLIEKMQAHHNAPSPGSTRVWGEHTKSHCCKPFPSSSREAGYGSDLPRTRVLQGATGLTWQNLDSVSKQNCICGGQCTSQQVPPQVLPSTVHTPSQKRATEIPAHHSRGISHKVGKNPKAIQWVAQLKTPTQIMDGCKQPQQHQKMPKALLAFALEQLKRPYPTSAVMGDGLGHSRHHRVNTGNSKASQQFNVS